ncbi:hypothetical protein E4U31_000043 [Claviceps sp. LM219 group G6]|nr:hypothetical protein E4U15_001285 [Claviceps sp. LM218 group G6]KAG6114893.1 hypothetical protein E4U31_000043 [Claviceps sp. LM219 group G6]
MNFYVRIVYKQHKEKKYAMAKLKGIDTITLSFRPFKRPRAKEESDVTALMPVLTSELALRNLLIQEFVDPGFPTDRTLYAPNSRHQKVHDGSTKAMAPNQMQTFTLVSHKARNHQNLPKFTIHH